MTPNKDACLRPCAYCGHRAKDHISYAFLCEHCSCACFDPGPLPRRWLEWGAAYQMGGVPAALGTMLTGWET